MRHLLCIILTFSLLSCQSTGSGQEPYLFKKNILDKKYDKKNHKVDLVLLRSDLSREDYLIIKYYVLIVIETNEADIELSDKTYREILNNAKRKYGSSPTIVEKYNSTLAR